MNNEFSRFTSESDVESTISLMRNGAKILIFKHSTRCGVSSHAYRVLQQFAHEMPNEWTIYLVDVIQERSLSNYIAKLVGISHQSPQLLFFDKGEITAKSHYSISKEVLNAIVTPE